MLLVHLNNLDKSLPNHLKKSLSQSIASGSLMWFEMCSFPAFRQGYFFLQGCVVNKYTKSLKAILSLMLTQKLRPGFPTIILVGQERIGYMETPAESQE